VRDQLELVGTKFGCGVGLCGACTVHVNGVGPHGTYNTAAYETELRQSVASPGAPVRDQGDIDAALAGAAKVLSFEYYAPLGDGHRLAHHDPDDHRR